MRFRFVALAAMLFALLVGCGSDDFSPSGSSNDGAAESTTRQAAPTPAPRAVPTPALVAEDSGGSDANVRVQLASFAQSRIIVHTARMTMVVENIADAVDRIGGVAESLNGWVVSSDRSSSSTGAIAIRVPAASLDEAFRRLEALAINVESRAVTSQDFTDEYVDTQSRLVSLRATEQRLLSFLERSANVEEALLVEAELSNLLQEIEAAQGRLNYLGETSAYSLIEVNLKIRAATDLGSTPAPTARSGWGSWRGSGLRSPPRRASTNSRSSGTSGTGHPPRAAAARQRRPGIALPPQ